MWHYVTVLFLHFEKRQPDVLWAETAASSCFSTSADFWSARSPSAERFISEWAKLILISVDFNWALVNYLFLKQASPPHASLHSKKRRQRWLLISVAYSVIVRRRAHHFKSLFYLIIFKFSRCSCQKMTILNTRDHLAVTYWLFFPHELS